MQVPGVEFCNPKRRCAHVPLTHPCSDGPAILLNPCSFTCHPSTPAQTCTYAEVKLYGDCVLRFVSGSYEGPFLPGWQAVEDAPHVSAVLPSYVLV